MTINNIEIDRLYYTKFLGALIDHKLSWKEHIEFIGKEVSKTIATIRKAKRFANAGALYNSIIYPCFTYCIEIWGYAYKTNIFYLHAKQKDSRIMCNASYLDNTTSLYLKLIMLLFPDIVKYFTRMFMFKTFQNAPPSSLRDISSQCCRTIGYEINFYEKNV